MGTEFKKLKFAFVNLTLDFLEEKDLNNAIKFAEDAKNFLQKEMGVTVVESAPSVNSRSMSNIALSKF